jgi:hypothetical protein
MKLLDGWLYDSARQPINGKGLKKKIWFSICSKHFYHHKDCELCKVGSWITRQRLLWNRILWGVLSRKWAVWWFNR